MAASALLVVLAVGPAATVRAQTFQLLLPLPGDTSINNRGISADGTVVVGQSSGAIRDSAIRWTAATGTTVLGTNFRNIGIDAWGVDGDGSVVVGSRGAQAYRWTATTGIVGLGLPPGAIQSQAYATNLDGAVVVGDSSATPALFGPFPAEAFSWTASSGFRRLGFLPGYQTSSARAVNADGSVVVGLVCDSMCQVRQQAFRWSAPTGMVGLGFLPGYTSSDASGVSADGSVVVGTSTIFPTNDRQAFRWTASTGMVGLGFLPGTSESNAAATNADGSVVVGGSGLTLTGGSQAMRWTAATGMQSIQAILNANGIATPGVRLWYANSVSADGTVIIGFADYLPCCMGGPNWIARIPVDAFALLDLGGSSKTLGSLLWGGTVTNGSSVPATLTFGGDGADTTFIGRVQDGVGKVALNKVGTGTTTLTGTHTYTGGTTVTLGTLQLGARGSLASSGALTVNGGTFDLNNNAQTVGTLSGLGGAITLGSGTLTANSANNSSLASAISGSGGFVKQGTGTLTLTGANSYGGGTTVSGGILQGNAASLQGSILNNAAVVFDQATDGTYAGAMTGTGTLTKQGVGTLILTGASVVGGGTTVNAGRLAVNGSLTSNLTVGAAGSLGGTGTLIGTVTNNGGTLAPGNSIGTLTVSGNLVQNGGVYQVEANAAGQADRINVSGTATINGGTVQVLASPGTYRNTTYTILNAAGGRSGTFSGVTSNLAFLTASLAYDPNNVFLTLSQSANAFAAGARTPNQYAVGTALDLAVGSATGDFATVLTALAALDTTQGPRALDAISGQNYAGFATAMLQGIQLFMTNFASQAGGGGGNRVALAEACDVACDATTPGLWGAWGGAVGGTGTVAGNSNAGGLTYNLGGFAAGIDRRLSPNLLVGATVGYQTGTQWTAGFDGRGTTDTFQVGLYAGFSEGPVYVDALAGYATSTNRLTRTIAIPGLNTRTAMGQTTANLFYGQLEAGYRLDLGGRTGGYVTPFVRLQGVTAMQDGFTESGANSLSLSVAQQTTNSLRSVLGATLGTGLELGWREKLALQFKLGWSHEYADTARPVTASFVGAPAIPFTVTGATPARDGFVVGLGASTAIAEATSVYLRYEGQVAVSGQDASHAAIVGLRMTW